MFLTEMFQIPQMFLLEMFQIPRICWIMLSINLSFFLYLIICRLFLSPKNNTDKFNLSVYFFPTNTMTFSPKNYELGLLTFRVRFFNIPFSLLFSYNLNNRGCRLKWAMRHAAHLGISNTLSQPKASSRWIWVSMTGRMFVFQYECREIHKALYCQRSNIGL